MGDEVPDRLGWLQQSAAANWNKITDPIGRLKYLEARYARLDPANLGQFREELTAAIRNAEPAAILNEPRVVTMVRSVFGERGVTRLKERAR
jgi:hypothetical protein